MEHFQMSRWAKCFVIYKKMLTVNEMCFVSKYIIENNNLYMVQVNLIISLHGPLHPHQIKILHMFNSSYKESHVEKKGN